MANTIKIHRGSLVGLPILNGGEFGFTTDSYQLYIGDGASNHEIVLDISPIESIDASNISGVVFTTQDGNTITESFGHHHEEYALSTETVIPNTEVVFGNGTGITSDTNLTWDGSTLDITGSLGIDSSLIDYQENLDVDTGVETIYTLPVASYTAFFFDYVVTKGANARSGTVMAVVVNSTTVEYTETSTNDIGNTSDVVLSVAISGSDLLLQSTTGSDDWIVKVLTRVI